MSSFNRSSDNKQIKYVFIADLLSKQIIHQEFIEKNLSSAEKDTMQIFGKVSSLKEFKFYEHSKVPNKNGNYCFLCLKPNLFYLSLIDNRYSEDDIFLMFEEINNSSIGENIKLTGQMKSENIQYLKLILEKYQKKSSIIKEINNDISDIKIEMKDNIRSLISNSQNLENLNKQSEDIKDGSAAFQEDARELKKQACWNNWKLIIIIICIVIAIIAVVVGVSVSKKSDNNKSNEAILTELKLAENNNLNTSSNSNNGSNNSSQTTSGNRIRFLV